ncbi:unnamed protein product [Ostreobium quekettii]|uniref:Uncharacterized protein n=1 Tax=Ostreobium quekettii TaxID=121088 RepID=A0A8S1J3X5_9CHLO|nr:unnamed protein product [Ostreobium quekettii]
MSVLLLPASNVDCWDAVLGGDLHNNACTSCHGSIGACAEDGQTQAIQVLFSQSSRCRGPEPGGMKTPSDVRSCQWSLETCAGQQDESRSLQSVRALWALQG